jgi:hypothetical protein
MTTSTLNGSNPGDYVIAVTPHDVLFGRGSGPNDHEGNITFRDLVAQRKQEYMATNHRQTKAKIAKSIVDQIFAVNGRFLKKLEPDEAASLGYSSGQDVYQVVEDDTVMEKAKQALRQNRNREDGAVSPRPPAKAAVTASSFPPSGLTPDSAGGGVPIFQPLGAADYGATTAAAAASMSANDARTTGISRHLHHDYAMTPNIAAAPSDDSLGNNFGMYDDQQLQQPLYMESDGYATYTTTLDDPEEDLTFGGGRAGGGGRGNPFNNTVVPAAGGPRRGSLLGGRKGDAAVAVGGGRRDSIQLADVWRRDSMMGLGKAAESMQMSELMESFKGMSTSGELNASTDTIGTIDNLAGMGGLSTAHMSGMSNMSAMSMGSMTSLFRSTPEWTSASLRNGSSFGGPPGVERAPSNDDMKRGPSGMNDSAYWGGGGGGVGGAAGRPNLPSHASERRTSFDIHSPMFRGQLEGSSSLLRAPLEGSSAAMLRGPLEGSSTMSFRSVGGPSSGSTPPRTHPSVTGIGYSNQQAVFDINNAASPASSPLESPPQQYQQQYAYPGRIVPGKRDDERQL